MASLPPLTAVIHPPTHPCVQRDSPRTRRRELLLGGWCLAGARPQDVPGTASLTEGSCRCVGCSVAPWLPPGWLACPRVTEATSTQTRGHLSHENKHRESETRRAGWPGRRSCCGSVWCQGQPRGCPLGCLVKSSWLPLSGEVPGRVLGRPFLPLLPPVAVSGADCPLSGSSSQVWAGWASLSLGVSICRMGVLSSPAQVYDARVMYPLSGDTSRGTTETGHWGWTLGLSSRWDTGSCRGCSSLGTPKAPFSHVAGTKD